MLKGYMVFYILSSGPTAASSERARTYAKPYLSANTLSAYYPAVPLFTKISWVSAIRVSILWMKKLKEELEEVVGAP